MATTFYLVDTLSSLTISGYVVRSLSTSRGSGVVTKTWTTTGGAPTPVYDTGTTQLAFAIRVNAVTINAGTNPPIHNHWGRESNAMANLSAQVYTDIYNNSGTDIGNVCGALCRSSSEYATSAEARNFSVAGFDGQTFADGDWLVLKPQHGIAGGTPGSGYTADFSYNGTTAAANGDTYVTFTETITEYVAPAFTPRPRPYLHLLPQ